MNAVVRRIGTALLVTGLFAGFASAGSASAAPLSGRSWVAAANGIVGVQQQVIVRAPQGISVATVTFTAPGGATNSGQASVNSAGFAYLNWTPNLPGTWTVTANGGGSVLDTSTVTVSAMPTSTILLTPGEVQSGISNNIVVQVTALGGSIAPSGTVSVRDQANNVVAAGALSASGTQRLATATLGWTPTAGSAPQLTATFTPSSTAFGASTSPTQTPAVAGAQIVSVRMPPILRVGVPATVSAVIAGGVPVTVGGSAAFNLLTNGVVTYPMGGSNTVNNGVASALWTPSQTGVQTVRVEYASNDGSFNGTDSQVVNVLAAPTPDTITVTPVGSAPWPSGNVGTLTTGNYVTVSAASASGNPVALASTGPCALDSAVLTLLGPGQCVVVASSLGNGGSLTPATVTYSVSVNPAPKKKRR